MYPLFWIGGTTGCPINGFPAFELQLVFDLCFFDFSLKGRTEDSLESGWPNVSLNVSKVLESSVKYPASSRDWHTPLSFARSSEKN